MAPSKDAINMDVPQDSMMSFAKEMTKDSPNTSKSHAQKDTKIMGLSQAEVRIILLSTLCYEAPPKMDWQKLVAKTGYTFRSAQVTFNKARRTFLAIHESEGVKLGATDAATDKDDADIDVGDGLSPFPSPLKVQAKRKASRKNVKLDAINASMNNDDDYVDVVDDELKVEDKPKAVRKRKLKNTLVFGAAHDVVKGMSEDSVVPSSPVKVARKQPSRKRKRAENPLDIFDQEVEEHSVEPFGDIDDMIFDKTTDLKVAEPEATDQIKEEYID